MIDKYIIEKQTELEKIANSALVFVSEGRFLEAEEAIMAYEKESHIIIQQSYKKSLDARIEDAKNKLNQESSQYKKVI